MISSILLFFAATTSLLHIVDSEIGTHCDQYGHGGVRITIGYDDGSNDGIANDEILQQEEILSITYLCYHDESLEKSSVLLRSDSEVGTQCNNNVGGEKVHIGFDNGRGEGVANDEILHYDEEEITLYLCNPSDGNDGEAMRITVGDEESGENCENGGKKIETGIDENKNNLLDDSEVTSTDFICNGNNTDGIGRNALVSFDVIAEGDGCKYGGKKMNYGVDTNSDGLLSEDEITGHRYFCAEMVEREEVDNSGCSSVIIL